MILFRMNQNGSKWSIYGNPHYCVTLTTNQSFLCSIRPGVAGTRGLHLHAFVPCQHYSQSFQMLQCSLLCFPSTRRKPLCPSEMWLPVEIVSSVLSTYISFYSSLFSLLTLERYGWWCGIGFSQKMASLLGTDVMFLCWNWRPNLSNLIFHLLCNARLACNNTLSMTIYGWHIHY